MYMSFKTGQGVWINIMLTNIATKKWSHTENGQRLAFCDPVHITTSRISQSRTVHGTAQDGQDRQVGQDGHGQSDPPCLDSPWARIGHADRDGRQE
jgi:hypothetical protein